MSTGRRRRRRPERPAIELTATVKADELRFKEFPETDVRFFGEPDHRSSSSSARTNLPDEVEPGTTYRDVRLDYRLASELVTRKPRSPASKRKEA